MRKIDRARLAGGAVSLVAALTLLAPGPAHAAENCMRPPVPRIPSGANTEVGTMLIVRRDIDAYLERMQTYVDCLSLESKDATTEADAVVDAWNVALAKYKDNP